MADNPSFSKSVRQWVDTFAHRSMRDSARYIKANGLSMPQFFLLMHLHRHEGCGISDLSAHMEITNAATSQLVDKLVQAGLLEREEDPHDRRAKQVTLSSQGREFIAGGIQQRYRWMEELEANLTPEEKLRIAEALKIMARAIRETEGAVQAG
jgi:DNA-binding MarR family transcriptional regulator